MGRKRIFLFSAIAIGIICFIAIYLLFDPSNSRFFPKCPFLMLTGLKCPGCGSQRAIHALLCGDILSAFRYNALLVISLPIILLYGIAELLRTRYNALYRKLNSPTAIWAIFVIVVLWWILRNIFNW